MFIGDRLPAEFNDDKIYLIAQQVLDLASEGLAARGLGEEKLLQPLYRRIESRTNPAKTMLKQLQNGVDLDNIIRKYAEL